MTNSERTIAKCTASKIGIGDVSLKIKRISPLALDRKSMMMNE